MTTIYLIRHGKSVGNINHIWGMDYPLSFKGIRQARKLAKLKLEPDIVISSNLKRTIKTAKIAFKRKRIEIDRRFNELNFGIYESAKYIRKKDGYMDPISNQYYTNLKDFHIVTKGTDATKNAKEFIDALKETSRKYKDKKIAIVSSAGAISSTIAYILTQDVNNFRYINLKNCEYIILNVEDDKIFIEEDIKVDVLSHL